MKKQIILICDMEGASGIFEENYMAKEHLSKEWIEWGRSYITSDVLAVCDACNEFGIDEILIYDGHCAGDKEYNILIDKLPNNVKFFDTEDRCFDYRRIRGQADINPYGVITVGQHARYGEEHAYFAHTIKSPPIKEWTLNKMHISEMSMGVLSFQGTRYIANIGCSVSMHEARELNKKVHAIPVKDKSKKWEPSAKDNYDMIKCEVLKALKDSENMEVINVEGPYEFTLSLTDEFIYKIPENISWKGSFDEQKAVWEAPSIEIGLELFNYVRDYIVRID